MVNKRKTQKDWGRYCGVPQCNTYGIDGVSMHRIPRKVMLNRIELNKWKCVLKRKTIPKHFVVCSKHFKMEQILIPLPRANKRKKPVLVPNAFPSENLPQSSIGLRKATARKDRSNIINNLSIDTFSRTEDDFENSSPTNSKEDEVVPPIHQVWIGDQLDTHKSEISVPVNSEPAKLNNIPFLIDTDEKLNSMTGIPTLTLLERLHKCCLLISSEDPLNIEVSLKNQIILTMFRIKTNMNNIQTAILFNISPKCAKQFFTDCVQLLAKVLKCCIYWQTREENIKNLPKCFEKFSNTITVLDCTEINTVTFRCLNCSTCTYSQCKGTHIVKVLLGISPSGLINYISTTAAGQTSNKVIFNLSKLVKQLKPGDAVMVDKGFMIGNELAEAGVEMIKPSSMKMKRTKDSIERDRLIASARVYVKRRIARLKNFKMMSEKISASILPYLDDIILVISAMCNLNSPILNDENFIKNQFLL